MLFPSALYRGPSGVVGSISVQPSGKPKARSHSNGVIPRKPKHSSIKFPRAFLLPAF